MILALFLLAPTVPSDPSPKNTAWTSLAGLVGRKSLSQGRLSDVTSSKMPTVK
jgi:hypothetical protein